MYVFAAFLVYSYAVVILYVCDVMYRYVIWFTSYVVMSCHVCVCMGTMNHKRDSVASANGSRYTSILRYCWLKLQSLKLAKANDNLSPNPSLSIGHCNKQCVIDYTFSLHRAAVRGGYADDELSSASPSLLTQTETAPLPSFT